MSIEKNFIVNAGIEVGTSANVATTLTVGGSASINSSVSVGNATVFTTVNSTAVVVSNTTLTSSSLTTGNSTVNTNITNSRVSIGNTTTNASITSTMFTLGNTTTNTSITPTSIFVGNSTVNSVITPSSISVDGTLTVQNLASFQGNVYVAGNLTVQGTTTFINSNSLDIGDNIITLNADLPPAVGPTENAGIEINRGALANTQLRWNETTDKWQITNDGTNYGDIRNSLVDIALGTETTGSYVATVAGGTGVYVTGSGSETAAVTVTIGQDVNATSSVAFAGVIVGNSSLKQNSIELATNRFIANASGITVTGFANVTTAVNTALFTSGVGFTANSTLVNTAALNVVNQVNTATLFATTSANVGTAFTTNSTVTNTVALNVVNQINTATLFATTSANVGANVQLTTSSLFVGNSTVNTVVSSTFIGGNSTTFLGNTTISGNAAISGLVHTITGNVNVDNNTLFIDSVNNRVGIGTTTPDAPLRVAGAANVTGNAVIGGTANITGLSTLSGGTNTTTANASVAVNIGANVIANTSALFVGNSTVNAVITSTNIGGNIVASLGNTTITGFVNATGSVNTALFTTGTGFTSNSTLTNTAALNVVGRTNTATLYVTTSANVGTAFTTNSTLTNTIAFNVVNQINTATLFATTSANVGSNVQLTTAAVFVGNSTVNTVISSTQIGGNSIAYLGDTIISGNVTIANETISSANITGVNIRATSNFYLENSSGYLRGSLSDGSYTRLAGVAGSNAVYIGSVDGDYINSTSTGVGVVIAHAPNSAALQIWSNSIFHSTFAANGNLGVNTTTPAYQLDVVGDVRASANLYGILATTAQPFVSANNSTNLNGLAASAYVSNSALQNYFYINSTATAFNSSNLAGLAATAYVSNSALNSRNFVNATTAATTYVSNSALTGYGFVNNSVGTAFNSSNLAGFGVTSFVSNSALQGYLYINTTATAFNSSNLAGLPATAFVSNSSLNSRNFVNATTAATTYVSNSALQGYGYVNNSVGTAFNSSNLAGLAATAYVSNSALRGINYTFTGVHDHSANLTIDGTATSQLIVGGTAVVVNTVGIAIGANLIINTNALDISSTTSTASITPQIISVTRNVATTNSIVQIIADATGYGRIELGGDTGGYIDFKTPLTDSYDHRIFSNTSGLYILGGSTTSTTANAVIFGAQANIDFYNNTLYVDALNGRVGVGNSNPAHKLSISGNVYASANAYFGGNIFLDNVSAYLRGTLSDGITPTRLIGVSAANSVFVGSVDPGALDVRVYGPSGAPVSIYSNATLHSTFAANGNLGINTSIPTYQLDVLGDTRITGDIIITGANSTINGVEIGYLNIPQNANNTNYTITANDSGKHIFNSTNATSLTYTIANNTNVPLAIGTAITFVNGNTATVTIAGGTGVTLQLAGSTTTGSRTISAGGLATALKVGTNRWFVSGAGVT